MNYQEQVENWFSVNEERTYAEKAIDRAITDFFSELQVQLQSSDYIKTLDDFKKALAYIKERTMLNLNTLRPNPKMMKDIKSEKIHRS